MKGATVNKTNPKENFTSIRIVKRIYTDPAPIFITTIQGLLFSSNWDICL